MEKRILLVEDDETLAEVLEIHIAVLGYSLDKAFDGTSGVQMATESHYELIILDRMLPELNGNEVCRRIREKDQMVPIMMLTSRDSDMDKVTGLELGADDYLTKPFKVPELLARIKALLRRAQLGTQATPAAKVLHFEDLVIDGASRRTHLRDQEIALTKTEFDVLYLLASNPGRTFTRNQLLQEVWGTELEEYLYAVRSLMYRLRKKIEIDPQAPKYIQTVRGIGYRFSDVTSS